MKKDPEQFPSKALTETSDIQHTDECTGALEGEALVDALDNVVKQPTVDVLGKSITPVGCLLRLQWYTEKREGPNQDWSDSPTVNKISPRQKPWRFF